MVSVPLSADVSMLQRQLAERDQVIAALRATLTSLEGQIAALQAALVSLGSENTLLKRRLFGTKSERTATSELQLSLGDLLDQHNALQKQLDELSRSRHEQGNDEPKEPPAKPPATPRPPPKGRRDLSASRLPKVVVEIPDPELAKQGKVIGYDESHQLMYQPGGWAVLVKRTLKYEIEVAGERTVLGTEAPKLLLPRGLLHSSALAFLAVQKFALGVPHYRLEQHLQTQGERLDRSTMCRSMEEMGNALGATVVEAMRLDTLANCRVLSTDATGAAIQPEAHPHKLKQACRKGHFFVVVGDQDHVLFGYTPEHTQKAVATMFAGFRGLLQSDASSVYHLLERGPLDDQEQGVELVGCWAHARRYFFEAAVCKYPVGVEGLTRIGAIYAAEAPLAKLPPGARQRERVARVGPLIDDFYRWVHEVGRTTAGRTLASKALGYAKNQEQELRRVLRDGRLALDNTRSERALRTVVVGRKNWMFYGSDVHAEAAAALFSLIASCRLHRLDVERYLAEVVRVVPYWPRERYLELAPKNWVATRGKLSEKELAVPAGAITVPA
jgi:transposase